MNYTFDVQDSLSMVHIIVSLDHRILIFLPAFIATNHVAVVMFHTTIETK